MRVRNPRTGVYDYEIPDCNAAQIVQCCKQLRNHQDAWVRSGITNRIAVLQEWKQAIIVNKELLVGALAADTGRTWETIAEVDWVIDSIDKWCATTSNFYEAYDNWIPYQLVAVISPWNFPLALSMMDTIPALLSGTAVLVKPSEVTPRFIEVLNRTILSVPGLQKILLFTPGDAAIGAKIVELVDLVAFTGSINTGKKIALAASKKLTPVLMKIGAKDPAIVMQGANLEIAATAILKGSTTNAGQNCLSFERIYVHESIHDTLVDLLVEKTKALQLVTEDQHKGEIGPIIFEKQVLTINTHLEDAKTLGAIMLTGSNSCEQIHGGFYCRPTILVNVTHNMLLMKEETFGPIMPIMSFSSTEEVVELANTINYSLGAAVFAATDEEAEEIANRIHVGSISINEAALTAILHYGDQLSFNMSGIGGLKIGQENFSRFLKKRTIHLMHNPS
jgi:succinate-semialdehyde dehydrogenase/glutarate-semialdehyde dehydrogenase